MRLKAWHFLVFVLALVAFGAALAPAEVIAPRRDGFTYQRATGSIWNAHLEGVRAGPYAVERVSWRLQPLALLTGSLAAPVLFDGGDIQGDVAVRVGLFGKRLRSPLLTVNGLPFGAVLLPGRTTATDLDIAFSGARCSHASGRLDSDALAQAGDQLGFVGPPLTGAAGCDGEDAVLRLTGEGQNGELIDALLRLRGDGRGAWRVGVVGGGAETEQALTAAGFQRDEATGGFASGGELTW